MFETTALRLGVPAVLLVVSSSCSLGGGGDGMTCNPAPQITSSPPTQATAGQYYYYAVDSAYVCGMIGPLCSGIDAVQLPPGATASDHGVGWTPDASQSNKSFKFVIATKPDWCGDVARQSWTVFVSPAR